MSEKVTRESDTYSDSELMRRIAAGDAEALSSLYDRHAALLFGLACKILSDQMLAEDVLQEVFVKVWQAASRFEQAKGNAVAWLTTLCRNQCIDRLRSKQKRSQRTMELSPEIINQFPDTLMGPSEELDIIETQHSIVAALRALPEEQRTTIELAYFQGLSQSEISAEINEPLGTVKTRMRLGMQKLRAFLVQRANNLS